MDERVDKFHDLEHGLEPQGPARGNESELEMNIQLFADDTIDWRKIVELEAPEADDTKYEPQAIFVSPDSGSDEEPPEGNEEDDEDDYEFEPIMMPRLSVTDKNLPYLVAGEMVVADEDGNLSSASVDDDGAVTTTPLLIDGDMIADDSISGSKLEENSITSRELDMDELFSDSVLMNQMLSENIDAEALFENEKFIEKFDEHHWDLANGIVIEGNTLNDLISAGRYSCPTAERSDALQGKPSDEPGFSDGFSVDVIRLHSEGDVQSLQQILRVNEQTWIRYGEGEETIQWQEWILQTDQPQLDTKVSKAGDTMTGPLVLSGAPTDALGASTKQYVDTAVAGEMAGNAASATKLNTARTIGIGGKVTGTATLFDGTADITINATAVDATTLNGQAASYYQHKIETTTVTLPTSSSWTNKEYTAAVSGVTAGSTVWVSPDADSFINYGQCRIRCIAQGANTLTFRYESAPGTTLKVIVAYQ